MIADIAIVGGGLAGGLIALALQEQRPELRIELVEAGPMLGGEQTWSFHDTDLCPIGEALVEPLVSWRWSEQAVRFPAHRRRLSTGYKSIESDRYNYVLQQKLEGAIRLSSPVAGLSPTAIRFSSGEEAAYGAVIDCRGALESPHLVLGFQKFVGQVLRLSSPHGLSAPIIMDATIPQVDGYRFVYVLPFDEKTVLIEDTRYADGPALPIERFREEIAAYARLQGWSVEAALREEKGVLPIALGGDMDAFWDAPIADTQGQVARGGMRAGLFHPLTGYSLPDAVNLALTIAKAKDLSAPGLYALTRGVSTQVWQDRSFYRLLTRMLFLVAEPEKRYRVLERFYKLPQGLIERLYVGKMTFADKARVLVGKPPVPFFKAFEVIPEASARAGGR
ncbi:MAG: lycopene beta-cyclase CrtY [Pseudomonadota bacterium]